MAPFRSVIPQAAGLLPKWQLLVSSLAVFNTVQNFLTLSLTKRIYCNQPHNGMFVFAPDSHTDSLSPSHGPAITYFRNMDTHLGHYPVLLRVSCQSKSVGSCIGNILWTRINASEKHLRPNNVDLRPRVWTLFI